MLMFRSHSVASVGTDRHGTTGDAALGDWIRCANFADNRQEYHFRTVDFVETVRHTIMVDAVL